MYAVVGFISAVVLAFPSAPWPLLERGAQVLAAVLGATLVPPLVAAWFSRRTLRLFDQRPDDPTPGQVLYGRGLMLAQGLLALGHGGVLALSEWPTYCRRVPVVGAWLVVPEVLSVVPFLASVVLVWVASYPADRAVRQIALESYLFRNKPLPPVWRLGEYLLFNLRHQVLFIAAPMLLILAAREVVMYYENELTRFGRSEFVPDFLLGTATAAVAVVAPVILRHVWITRRLADGPLRDRLVNLCRTLKLRYREILVWRCGGLIVNAAVMGVLPPLRYLLITDGMIQQLDDRKIEAVFGHEAGHVKRHHILFFLLFALISGCIVTLATVYSRRADSALRHAISIGLGLLLAFKWGVLFGWVSRRFERQADIFGVRTLALIGLPCELPCALHGPRGPSASPTATGNPHAVPAGPIAVRAAESPADARDGAGGTGELDRGQSQRGDPLCSTAAEVFSDTLRQVATLNGIAPEARSWRHGSIASRAAVLPRFAADPAATARFERQVRRIKTGILTVALVLSIWAAYEMRLWGMVRPLLGMG